MSFFRPVTPALWALGIVVAWPLTADAQASLDEENGRLVMRNEHMTLALGIGERGAVVSLAHAADGRELVATQHDAPLFRLVLSDAADPETQRFAVSSADARTTRMERDGDEAAVRIDFPGCVRPGLNVSCRVALSPGEPWARFSIAVDVPEGLILEDVQYPFVALRCPPAQDAQGEAAVMGSTKGGVYPQPSGWRENTRVSARQPGSLAAQFGCYYDARAGALLATHDTVGRPKTFQMHRTGEVLEMFFVHHCYDTGRFLLEYETALGAFSGGEAATDWRHAADIYKAWAERQPWCERTFAERDDLPEWLRAGPAQVRFNRAWLARPETIERWLEAYWRRFFPTDLHLITAYWGWEKVDTWVTPDYFPAFPSDEQFTDLVRRTREFNAHAFLWPSGYYYTLTFDKQEDDTFRWDDRERFERDVRPHAVLGRDGSLWTMKPSWLRGGETAQMCPGDPWTIGLLNEIAGEIALRGVEMVQIDQVVGAGFRPCYSDEHHHPPGNGPWMTEVFRRQLDTMLEACRAVEPDAVVCFEEPNEIFNQQVGIQDYRDWEVLRRDYPLIIPASVFNYIYHEYLPTFQSNPRSGDLVMAAYCLVNGQMPHLVPWRYAGAGPAPFNGAFEEWDGNVPTGWDKVPGYMGQVWSGRCFRDDEVKHTGAASLRLECDPDQVVQVSQNVAVGDSFRVGGTYRFSAWMRAEGAARDNGIGFATFTSNMQSTGGGGRLPMPRDAAEGWVHRTAQFTVPPDSTLLRIMIHFTGPGTVWVDDVLLEEVLPDGTFRAVTWPETPPDHEFMLRWVEMYSGEGRPYLLLGRMLHPPPLEVPTIEYQNRPFPAILHNAYRAPDGSEAVVLANITAEPQAGVLTWAGERRTVQLGPWEARLMRD